MPLSLSVTQAGDKLRVYAQNTGSKHVIIDNIVLTVQTSGSLYATVHYEGDFYFGTGRVPSGWSGLMVEQAYAGGKAKASAKADFWEVDKKVSSSKINIS